MNDVITLGCKTSTGGKIISGNSGVTVNNKPIALIGDKATCLCGSSNCKGIGEIVPIAPRAANVQGVNFARAGDLVNTGCGNCFLIKGPHQVHLGTSMDSPVHLGSNVHIGNGVKINMGKMSAEENEANANSYSHSTYLSSHSSQNHHSSQSPVTQKKKTNEKVYAKAASRPHGNSEVSILKELFKSSFDEFGYFVDIANIIIPKAHAMGSAAMLGEMATSPIEEVSAGSSVMSKTANKNQENIQFTKLAGNLSKSIIGEMSFYARESGIQALFAARAREYHDDTQYTASELEELKYALSRIRVRLIPPQNGSQYPTINAYNVNHASIPVRHVHEKNGQFSVKLSEDTPTIYWTPNKSDTPIPTTTPSQDDGIDFDNLLITPTTTFNAGIEQTHPIAESDDWNDLILVFPENSGIKPLYIVFNQPSKHLKYIPAPKGNPPLPAFPEAVKAKKKTSIQGGGGLRERWKDKKGRIYEWDSQHGKVEMYTKQGKHLGEYDHITGDQTKSAEPNRKVEK